MLRSRAQDASRRGRVEYCVHERLCTAGSQYQDRPVLNRPLCGGFRALENEICHGPTFQIGSFLYQDLLLFIEARIESIAFLALNSLRGSGLHEPIVRKLSVHVNHYEIIFRTSLSSTKRCIGSVGEEMKSNFR